MMLPVQDMDMGVLFCTYSLLNQKSLSGKEVTMAVARDPHVHGHMHILDIHERQAAHEASKGELEFGGLRQTHAAGASVPPATHLCS